MTWVKLDDAFFDHPKIIALSPSARLAYIEALCYASRNLTDGFLPLKKAKEIAGRAKVVSELVPALWEIAEGGYRVHDYLDYQPKRDKVLADRSAARERMFGKRSGNVRPKFVESSAVPVPVPVPVPEEKQKTEEAEDLPTRPLIFSLYENAIGGISGLMVQKLKEAEQEYPAECVEHSFEAAVVHNKRSWAYVEAILKKHAMTGDCYAGRPSGNSRADAAPVRASDELAKQYRYAPTFVLD